MLYTEYYAKEIESGPSQCANTDKALTNPLKASSELATDEYTHFRSVDNHRLTSGTLLAGFFYGRGAHLTEGRCSDLAEMEITGDAKE